MNSNEVKFREEKEQWFSYILSDETTLKLKPILIKVINEGKDIQGNPLFSLQTTNVIGISPPDSMSPDEARSKKEDLKFKDLNNDNWNEYNLDNDIILKLKPIIAQINKTGEVDSKGFPIYTIQAQTLIKQQK